MTVYAINYRGSRAPTSGADDCTIGNIRLDEQVCAFYRHALRILQDNNVPVMVGGAFALLHYAGVSRHTKDFDIFLREDDVAEALALLSNEGYGTKMVSPLWLAKAFEGDSFVDFIFGSGNGVIPVDDEWFKWAEEANVLGVPASICPAEEVIWSKAFIMERDRYDGADIAHIIAARHDRLDWPRLLRRFAVHWRVLFSHLVLFGYIYPGKRHLVPEWVMSDLTSRLAGETASRPLFSKVCQGPLLAKTQYVTDTAEGGLEDVRFPPWGSITPEEAER